MSFPRLTTSCYALLTVLLLTACVSDDFAYEPMIVNSVAADINDNWQPGDDWFDIRDGQAYGTLEINNKVWMTRNFNFLVEEGGSYYGPGEKAEDRHTTIASYKVRSRAEREALGLLYDWQTASAVAPEGWRLPTSQDWAELKEALSMTGVVEVPFEIKAAYYDFDFKSGGIKRVALGYQDLGKAAYYWSAEAEDSNVGYVTVEERMVEMNKGKSSPRAQMSVRYIKE